MNALFSRVELSYSTRAGNTNLAYYHSIIVISKRHTHSTPFDTALTTDHRKIWTLGKTATSFYVLCNGVLVLDYAFSGTCCYIRSI